MKLNKMHSDWFSNQKITKEVLETFNVYTTVAGTIAFPVHDGEGNFIFNKYRRSPEIESGAKYTYDKGGKITLYGWGLAKKHDTILITEGEKDCLVAWSHNIPAVTSTGGAMSFQEEWVELFKGKTVILCFDNDKAGGQGMSKVAKLFGVENVKILFLPDRGGLKDISDYVTGGGDLHSLIKTARVIKDVEDDKSEKQSLFEETFFHDSFLKEEVSYTPKNKAISKKAMSDKDQAKAYPIYNLITFNSSKDALCPFHKEKTASLHYYPKTNSTYCFGGCGQAYDAIDIYQKINNLSFKEAVNELNKI